MGYEEMIARELGALPAVREISVEHRDLKVEILGDAAVATSFPVVTATLENGESLAAELRVTEAWVETPTGWTLVHEHNTRMDED